MQKAADFADFLYKNAERAYCFVHEQDLDGIASAAMLVHFFNVPLCNIFFGRPGKKMDDILKKIREIKPKGKIVIFADIATNPSVAGTLGRIVYGLKGSENYIAWIDHHPLGKESRKIIGSCDFSIAKDFKDKCAADLIYGIGKNIRKDKGMEELDRLAHMSDFNLKDKKYDRIIAQIAGAIHYINGRKDKEKLLRKMVKLVGYNKYEDNFINKAYKNYAKLREAEIGKMLDRLQVHRINNTCIGIGYGKNISSGDACNLIHEKANCDISVFINTESNTLHFRGYGTECLNIARQYGGNGHTYASGADFEKGSNNIKQIIKGLLSKAEKVY